MANITQYIAGDYLNADLVSTVSPEKRFVVFTKENGHKPIPSSRGGDVTIKPFVKVIFCGKPIEWTLSRTAARIIARNLGDDMDAWVDCQADLDVKVNGNISYIVPKNVYKSDKLAFSDGTVKPR